VDDELDEEPKSEQEEADDEQDEQELHDEGSDPPKELGRPLLMATPL
jgi:hypothetical protein